MRHSYRWLLVCVLAGCGSPHPDVMLHAENSPPNHLSEWGVLITQAGVLTPNDGVEIYDLNTPLFSDYAQKLRTIWTPQGTSVSYTEEDVLEFPVGTIISKTFYYEKAGARGAVVRADVEPTRDDNGVSLDSHEIIETRLLVRYDSGWKAYPYVWNSEQSDATFEIAGDLRSLSLVGEHDTQAMTYVVPDVNQCAGCHKPNHSLDALQPLGPQAWQLNRDDQLERWSESGWLTGMAQSPTKSLRWSGRDHAPLEPIARDYLDANCAHCHNPDGPADTSALHLNREARLDRNFGLCKPPVAVGRGSGDRPYDIYPGDPERSIMVYRMQHTDPAIAMPELGRSAVHAEGVAVISDWIQSLPGDC